MEHIVKYRLNVERLIRDLGGITRVAVIAGTHRSTPHRWLRVRSIKSAELEKIKAALPDLSIDDYFEPQP